MSKLYYVIFFPFVLFLWKNRDSIRLSTPLQSFIYANRDAKSSLTIDSTTFYVVNKNTKVTYPINYESTYPIIVSSLNKSIKDQNINSDIQSTLNIIKDSTATRLSKSYFKIEITKNTTTITAPTDEGLHNGINSLNKLIMKNSGKLPLKVIEDYSALDNRALHIVIRNDSILKYYSWIDSARYYNYNKIILRISNRIDLDAFSHFKSAKPRLSKQDFIKFVNYIKQSGFEIIPEIKLLTKQQFTFSDENNEFLYNKLTYDPRNDKVYQKVFPLIDEVIRSVPCNILHIGHDELYGIGIKNSKQNIQILPAKLFTEDVNKLQKYLSKKNIRTMMWGDMLWSRIEFPDERGHKLGLEGYETIVNQISKDIIICDWHYKSKFTNFPTLKKFSDQGFEVWGATWDDMQVMYNYTQYLNNQSLKKQNGMIATTWNSTTNLVFEIIRKSGNTFWNAK